MWRGKQALKTLLAMLGLFLGKGDALELDAAVGQAVGGCDSSVILAKNASNVNFRTEGTPRMVVSEASLLDRALALPVASDCISLLVSSDDRAIVKGAVRAATMSRADVLLVLVTANASRFEETRRRSQEEKLNFDLQLFLDPRSGTFRVHRMLAVDRPAWRELNINYVVSSFFAYPTAGGQAVGGFDPEVWEAVAAFAGASIVRYNLVRNYNELGLAAANGTGDVSISQPSLNRARYIMGVEFSWPMVERTVKLLHIKPGPARTYKAIFIPFGLTTWALVALSTAVAAGLLTFINARHENLPKFHIFTSSTSTLISESMPAAYLRVRTNFPAFLTLFIWLPCAYLIALAYRSTLLASLVLVEYEKPIDTFQDVLDNNVLLMMSRGNILTTIMENSPNPVVRAVYRDTVNRGGLFDMNPDFSKPKAIERMLQDGTGAILSTPIFVVGTRHKFRLSSNSLPATYSGYYYSPRHPLASRFDSAVARLAEAGVDRRLLDKHMWVAARPERDFERSGAGTAESQVALDLIHLSITLMILAAGVAAAAGGFLLERAAYAADQKEGERRTKRAKPPRNVVSQKSSKLVAHDVWELLDRNGDKK